MAERVGFEPTEVLPSLVFKTSTINRSDTSPHDAFIMRVLRTIPQPEK